jgi:uncharacterized membrane protein
MKDISKLIVNSWLIIAIATLVYAIIVISMEGWEKGSPNLFIPFIATSWYLFRRGMYKRMTKNGQ